MNSLQISYRTAIANDAWAIISVHYAAVQAVGPEHYSDKVLSAWSPQPDEHRREWLAGLVVKNSTLCMVAVSGESRIVGFCIALPAQAQIKALYVHPDFSGAGVGNALLQNIEVQCRASGLEVIELNASYNAEAFYRQRGYEALGSATQSLTDDVAMGAIHMVKRFSQVG